MEPVTSNHNKWLITLTLITLRGSHFNSFLDLLLRFEMSRNVMPINNWDGCVCICFQKCLEKKTFFRKITDWEYWSNGFTEYNKEMLFSHFVMFHSFLRPSLICPWHIFPPHQITIGGIFYHHSFYQIMMFKT